MVGNSGRDKTGSSLAGGDGEHKSGRGKTKRGCKGERDGEPADTSEKITLGGGRRAGGNGGLPVGLVNEDSTEVTDDVDNTEHETISGKHCEVRSLVVIRDRTTSIRIGVEEALAFGTSVVQGVGGIDLATFLGRVGNCPVQEGVDLIGRICLDVDNKDHGNENGEDNDGVEVTGNEGSLKTAGTGVEDDTPGDQEGSKTVIDSSEGLDGGGTTKQKHGRHNNVGAECEEKEGEMGCLTPTGTDNLTYSMG
mmetsp:Transcript_13033/g.28231  ORF Transcript_13033/g.28231 Transcript_13033/m.28231 type:complete len:251 (-) Transcript_13033:494-1246(-)